MEAGRDERSERTLLDGLLHYLGILFRYRWIIIITTLAATAGAVAFAIISIRLPPEESPLPNVYSAEALVLIGENAQSDLATSLLQGLGIDSGAAPAPGQSNGDLVLEILNSRVILDRVINDFDMARHYHVAESSHGATRDLVRQKSHFIYDRHTGILRISYEDIDPQFSCQVVNKMVSLLDEWFNTHRRLAAGRQLKELEQQLTEVSKRMALLRNRQKALQEKYGVLNVEDLGRSQSTLLANLRAQLLLKELDIKNYSAISRIDDPRLAQLKEERQNLIDLINHNEGMPSATLPGGSGQNSLPDVAQEFSQISLQLGVQERIYDTLAPQYEAARLSPSSIFQVIELAEVPDTKSGPQRSRIVMIVALVALAASVLFSLSLNVIRGVRDDPSKQRYFHAGPSATPEEPDNNATWPTDG